MTENESTNAQQGMPVQGKMQSGWYAAQDDEYYFYIDQWVMFDHFLVVHTLKKWSGDEFDEVEDDEHWYDDFDFRGTAPQLFATKEECKNNEKSRQDLMRAKDEMETNAKDSKLIAALKEFNGGDDGDNVYGYQFRGNLERVLKKMGCEYYNLSLRPNPDALEVLKSAIQILREGHIIGSTDRYNKTLIPLSSVSLVSRKEHIVTIEINTGDKYVFPESSDQRLYKALREVFEV